jgi:hypothetical protein
LTFRHPGEVGEVGEVGEAGEVPEVGEVGEVGGKWTESAAWVVESVAGGGA